MSDVTISSPRAGRRPLRSRLGRIGPTIVLLACAVFFIMPMLSMARFALQNVPGIKHGWSTLDDKG